MDARPQRPSRAGALQPSGNENIAPVKQVLHQRHKSAGNLKTIYNPATAFPAGGLNVAPKRAVFGEMNTNAKSAAQDLPSKKASMAPVVSHVGKENSGKPAALQKPAQRSSKSYAMLPQQPSAADTHGAALRKATADVLTKPQVTKKTTFVYQDTTAAQLLPEPNQHMIADHPVILPKPDIIKNPRHYKSQPQLKPNQPVLRRTLSRQFAEVASLISSALAEEAQDPPYEDALEEIADINGSRGVPINILGDYMEEPNIEIISHDAIDDYPSEEHVPAPPTAFESEDGWEEEDGDMDDEQGYTTAHSYRSHGENTTGGLTELLAPKATARVQQELEQAKAIVEESRTIEEIEEEQWDVSMVAEYGEEIFEYMRELETRMTPDPHYMDIQTEIQWSMRSVLIDWVVQVHHRFTLLPETLFLCVNYIDRFLSQKVVSVAKLQLVGATAIFIAAKYEEINCPSVNEIIFMVDNGFSADEILKAERFMLSMLQFELGWPGPMSFLRRISKADDYDLETRTLAKYFLEVTIMDERFVGCPPSFLAAGAHCLSRMILEKGDWSQAHTYWSGYTWSQLRPLVALLFDCCQYPEKHHQAVFEKYCDRRYKGASTFVQRAIARGWTPPFPIQQPFVLDANCFAETIASCRNFSSMEVGRMMATATQA
ncbi:B-type cyclin [Pyricularia oryzae]